MWGQHRQSLWDQISTSNTCWDMIVVGGGITGAGILREARRAGLKTLLVEQRDFSWGTSSRSSKLVHGGLRYLKEGRVFLTRESVLERERLLREAPGLVEHLYFLISTFKGQKPSKFTFTAGLTVYDLIAKHWDHQSFDRREFMMLAPHLDASGLEGGLRYSDAQTDDSRMVLRLIQESIQAGGFALNYTEAKPPIRRNGQVVALPIRDAITGAELELPTRCVVNATGVWVDTLRAKSKSQIRPLRGSHIIFPSWRFPASQAMTLVHPHDNRPCFIIPWEGTTMFGTTDVDHHEGLDQDARMTAAELQYLLEALTSRFPSLELKREDVIASFAGVRPVISTNRNVDPSKESREHKLWNEKGLITITGGKLTTFRPMAFAVLKAAKDYLPDIHPDKKAPAYDPFPVAPADQAFQPELAQRLVGRYGANAPALIACAEPGELELIPGTKNNWAELRWAARVEGVVKLEDLLLRRCRLGLLTPGGGESHKTKIEAICREELGWDEARWQLEWREYRTLWHRCYSLPNENEASPTASQA